MENTSVNKPAGTFGGESFLRSLIILALGVTIGIFATRYYAGHGISFFPHHEAGSPGNYTASYGSTSMATNPTSQPGEWNPVREMHQMQDEMNRVFQGSFENFGANPKFGIFQENPSYSLSLGVQDLKNRYEVHAFLPDAKIPDVNVELDGNQLKVDVINKATEKQKSKSGDSTTTEWGHYEQVIQLAGKLNDHGMKIVRKEHEMIITIPKA